MICFYTDFFSTLANLCIFSVLPSCFLKSMYALWLSMMPEIVLFISQYPQYNQMLFWALNRTVI